MSTREENKFDLRQSNWPKSLSNLLQKFVFKLSSDCEKASNNDQLYENNTNTTTSSTDLSDFISNSNTSTSGNTRTSNTNSSSNNSSNNSNQLNGQDSSFPAGGKYKLLNITSRTLWNVARKHPIVESPKKCALPNAALFNCRTRCRRFQAWNSLAEPLIRPDWPGRSLTHRQNDSSPKSVWFHGRARSLVSFFGQLSVKLLNNTQTNENKNKRNFFPQSKFKFYVNSWIMLFGFLESP